MGRGNYVRLGETMTNRKPDGCLTIKPSGNDVNELLDKAAALWLRMGCEVRLSLDLDHVFWVVMVDFRNGTFSVSETRNGPPTRLFADEDVTGLQMMVWLPA